MGIKSKIIFFYKFLLRGYKASTESYTKYLRKRGMKIGENCWFHNPATNFIDTDKPYMITIGNNVHIAGGVSIVAHGYDWIVLKHKYGGNYASAGKVKIGNNVFIGINTTILKDSEIGDNVIIGAGSLVNGKIESNCVAAGVPARKIMSLDDYKVKRKAAILEEAVEAYKAACERGVFPTIRDSWEFRWIYDSRCEEKYFESFEEFKAYASVD